MSVIVKLKGGLGNQLFIWAAGYSLARRLGVDLIADVSSFHDDRFGRKFELDNLNHGMVGLLSDPEAVAAMTEKHSTFTESGFAYDPLFETCQDKTVLDGHFQSYKYFWEYKSEIIAQLMSSFNFTQEIRFLESIPNRVHLRYRLGDYLTQPILGVLSPGYFVASLRRSGQGGPIILFSDEAKRALDLLPRGIVANSIIVDNGGGA